MLKNLFITSTKNHSQSKNRYVNTFIVSLLIVLVATTSAACSSSNSKSKTNAGSINTTSAMDEFLFGKEDTSQKIREKYEELENDVLKCMTKKGWEYSRTKIPDDQLSLSIFQSFSDFSKESKREKFGYGVFTILNAQGEPDLDLEDEFYGNEEESDDKNQEYVDGLSETEQERYYIDLYGADVAKSFNETRDSFDEEGAPDAQDESDLDTGDVSENSDLSDSPFELDDKSCSGAASKKAFGDESDLFKIFEDSQNVMEKFYKSKKVAAAVTEWKACVKSKIDTTGSTEINKSVKKALSSKDKLESDPDEIVGQAITETYDKLSGFDPDEDFGSDVTSDTDISDGDLESIESQSDFEPKSFNPKKYAKQERKIAATDFACQEKHYLKVKFAEQRSLEEEFIKDHKEEFASLKKQLSK